jgi:phytoene dehydrogenase-like protein
MTDWSPTLESARRARLEPPERVDVAVVGAGLGGLATAAWLARAGFKVAVFDGHYVAGGCATMFARKGEAGRFHFDVGLHYIGDCGEDGMIPRILRGVGADVEMRPLDPEGFDTLVFPDFRFRIPADVDLFRERLVALFPKEKRGIDRYLKFLRELDRIARRFEADGGRTTLRTGLEVLLRGRSVARNQRRTIADVLDECTRDPKLRAVLLAQHGDYGLAPSQVSALLHGGLANHYFHGAFYPAGGGQAIADRLAAAVEANGGTIHLRRGIERILVEDGRVVGVRTEAYPREAHVVRAQAVVSNADLKRTALELVGPEHLPAEWAERVRGFRMAGALFITFLGVRDDLAARGMGATNYWQFDGYDFDAAYRAIDGGKFEPAGCYVTSATLKDPGSTHHAPPGIHSVEVMALVPGDAAGWGLASEDEARRWHYRFTDAYQERKAAVEADLVGRFDRMFPGVGEKIVFRESATPISQMRYTRASGGTAYGIAASPDQFLDRRPGYRGPIPGLWLCGASTRAGHGIVGALTSGYHAAAKLAASMGRPIPRV